MNRTKLLVVAAGACLALAGVVRTVAIGAEPAKEAAPAADQSAPQLPPGWTPEDMQAFAAASTPGKMQQHLAKDAGVWQGKQSTWMFGVDEPTVTECTTTVTPLMDGRYTQVDVKGEMPGMGPYHGIGLYGFDNVAKEFACTWIDSYSTGLMHGTGHLSSDGKSLTWQFSYHCPITKKPAALRQVETNTGPDSKTLEMWGNDPKSGKEYKMMRIEMTRKK